MSDNCFLQLKDRILTLLVNLFIIKIKNWACQLTKSCEITKFIKNVGLNKYKALNC